MGRTQYVDLDATLRIRGLLRVLASKPPAGDAGVLVDDLLIDQVCDGESPPCAASRANHPRIAGDGPSRRPEASARSRRGASQDAQSSGQRPPRRRR